MHSSLHWTGLKSENCQLKNLYLIFADLHPHDSCLVLPLLFPLPLEINHGQLGNRGEYLPD